MSCCCDVAHPARCASNSSRWVTSAFCCVVSAAVSASSEAAISSSSIVAMRRDKVAALAFDLSEPTLDRLKVGLDRVIPSEARNLRLDDLRLSQHRLHSLPDCSIDDVSRDHVARATILVPTRRVAAVVGAPSVVLDLHDEAAIAATDVAASEERCLRVAVVAGRRPLVDRSRSWAAWSNSGVTRGEATPATRMRSSSGRRRWTRLPLTLSTLQR